MNDRISIRWGDDEMKKKEQVACREGDCRVESLVSVDDRGQMVLPKDLRDRANIRAGDKLAVITWEKDGEICCFTLIKADHLAGQVRDFLGPVMRNTLK
jgi:AbrB family looped-hinge helix DNA binding protein